MAKIDPEFPHDIFTFLHKPLRDGDKETFNFLERFLIGPQTLWEEKIAKKFNELTNLIDPALTTQPRFLKDHVGFTSELDNIQVLADFGIGFAPPAWDALAQYLKKAGVEPRMVEIVLKGVSDCHASFDSWMSFSWGEISSRRDHRARAIPSVLDRGAWDVSGCWFMEC